MLDSKQMAALTSLLRQGSENASQMLAKWIGKPAVIEINSLEQIPLEDAAELLSADDEPMCFCSSEIKGLLTGELILAFDDISGLALADMLLDQPAGTSQEWNALATSAALETTNILGCSYLNSMSASFSSSAGSAELLPSPPIFTRDFAPSLLEFALMGQALSSEEIILAKTRFEIGGSPATWTLLLIPDGPSMSRLPGLLSDYELSIKETS
jgi:chemotaxis protein CheC